jgi:tRNA(fMet)-specific endonuclease VapC
MNGNDVALDTNQAVAVLNDSHAVIDWLNSFKLLFLPVPVIGELRFGALNSARSQENLNSIDQLLSRCQILEINAATSLIYAQLRLELKQKGRPIPGNDLWIAASCLQHSVPLATEDAHFDAVASLRVLRLGQY